MDHQTRKWLREQAVVIGCRNVLDCNDTDRSKLIEDIFNGLVNAWNHTWEHVQHPAHESARDAWHQDAEREARRSAEDARYPEV